MKRLVFVASHVGYPMDRTPLGGGAMVGLQLVKHWKPDASWKPVILGSGPETPAPGCDYHRLAAREGGLVDLGELDYARFCRDFEAETTAWILERRKDLPPKDTVIVVNDVSEGPGLEELAAAGYQILSIWHVDVVDYFNKLYLRRIVAPEKLTRLHERMRSIGADWILPDVLDLVFEKQRQTVYHSKRMIVPSRAMADTLMRCYGDLVGYEELARRIVVVPWGVWSDPPGPADENRAAELKEYHEIGENTTTLLTLSRISPEKGVHLLLEGLRLLETSGKIAGKDIRLFICGEPAFMMGQAYGRKVKAAAAKLKQVKVVFPGYLDGAAKRAYFKLGDLFVSPSIHESYGLNVVEAMHAGLPVLASDHYGVRDTLPPDAGRLVHYPTPKKAPPLLAAALLEMIADKAKLKKMGEAAREAASAMPFSAAADAVRLAALGLLK
ncbi:MAG: glycosyltransferase family 4 protein [Elusimicrobiota bacterium]|nr:MAG: glycosyltransferase family 4 protein [Elusimicrobiota bacterium]